MALDTPRPFMQGTFPEFGHQDSTAASVHVTATIKEPGKGAMPRYSTFFRS